MSLCGLFFKIQIGYFSTSRIVATGWVLGTRGYMSLIMVQEVFFLVSEEPFLPTKVGPCLYMLSWDLVEQYGLSFVW